MATNLVGVQDFGGQAGATIWWALNARVDAATLRRVWDGAGLGVTLPPEPSAEQKLGRAIRKIEGQHTICRPLARRGRWAVVEETVSGVGDTAQLLHRQSLSVWIQPGALTPTFSEWSPLAARILGVYQEQDGWYTRDDLGLWFVKAVIATLYGTALRPAGGVYYVPPQHVGRWQHVAQTIEAAGAGVCYTMPTLQSADVTRAVLDALVRETSSTTEEWVEAITDGKLGSRALRARVADCEALQNHLSEYEGLLGSALDAVRAKVSDVSTQALVAAFAAEAKAEEERAAAEAAKAAK